MIKLDTNKTKEELTKDLNIVYKMAMKEVKKNGLTIEDKQGTRTNPAWTAARECITLLNRIKAIKSSDEIDPNLDLD